MTDDLLVLDEAKQSIEKKPFEDIKSEKARLISKPKKSPITSVELSARWQEFKKYLLKNSPELKFMHEGKPKFSNQLITVGFALDFLHDQFIYNKVKISSICTEFFGSDVAIISQIIEDTNKEMSSENNQNTYEKNTLSDLNSSNTEYKESSEITIVEKFLIEKFKAKDITNRI